jgi:hypothetical protein
VRKVDSKASIRYLRCRCCGREFRERKGTALWNTNVSEANAIAVASHLSAGGSQASTVRLVAVDIRVVERLNRVVGKPGQQFDEAHVKAVVVEALAADERDGFSATKPQPAWAAAVMDPQSKLMLAHQQGKRDEALIRRLYADVTPRVANRPNWVRFTDGEPSDASRFAEYFGLAYRPSRQGAQGRLSHLLDFDASKINPPTVRFGPRNLIWANQGGAAPVKNKGHLERSLELDEVTKDADTDMVLQFPTAETGLGAQDTEGCVKGRLTGAPGQDFKFFGCDHLRMVPAQAAQSLTTDASADGAALAETSTPEVTTRIFLPLVTR